MIDALNIDTRQSFGIQPPDKPLLWRVDSPDSKGLGAR